MSWRDDYAGLRPFERARDCNHSPSSALASCIALPTPSMESSGRKKHVRSNGRKPSKGLLTHVVY